ncbi:hypothetical protein A9X02_24880 [Mycobacterium malmoense]|nr:hypothetical protein A9X02_24880 [Mycobacterium malmoense]
MVAFVFDGQFDVLPTHVEDRDELAVFAVDRNLRTRPRIAGLDEQQPQPRLARRFRARVDECQRAPSPPDVAMTFVAFGESLHLLDIQPGCACQRIDGCDRRCGRIPAGKVESGACRGGCRYSADQLDFVGRDALRPRADSGRWTTVLVHQLSRATVVDPLGVV